MISAAILLLLSDSPLLAPSATPAAEACSAADTPCFQAATTATPADAGLGDEMKALRDEALAAYQAGNCDVAMPSLKTVIAADHRSSDAAIALRDCYEKKYGAAGALTQLETEVKANPLDPVAHDNLGCFYLMAQRFDEARSELSKAIELDPKSIDARLNLAFWYAQVGQSHTAVREQEAIVVDDPTNKRALTELCYLIAERENDAKRAEPYCARAAAGDEANEMAGVSLGLVRLRSGDLDGAEKAFQTILAANPKAHTARTFYGVARMQRGDYDGAEASFQQVLQEDPTDMDARLGLARSYQARKAFGAAVEQYRTAYHQRHDGMLLGALVKAYLQQYFLLVIGALLAAMAVLLWRYLDVKTPAPAT